MKMEIYPALDLLDGRCVRLKKGQFDDQTVYFENPSDVLGWLENAGAKNLHLVDLSGAKDPQNRQLTWIRNILAQSALQIQYGGGLRTLAEIREVLGLGVQRVVLGSVCIQKPDILEMAIREFGTDRITVALDVGAGGKIAISGWKELSEYSLNQWIDQWLESHSSTPISRILCTDIDRDGMMQGPNFQLYSDLVEQYPQIEIQASGGISHLQDLTRLKAIGVPSAILGRAMYEKQISLPEAIAQC